MARKMFLCLEPDCGFASTLRSSRTIHALEHPDHAVGFDWVSD